MGLYFGIADAQGFGGAEAAEDPSAAPDGLRRSIAAAFCSEVSQVFQERRREHKQRFAWIRAGKKDCGREAISPDEFKAWLKDS